jgi:pyruvate dehydrogenase E2 component (dihydrolipoamide acetyltransferase)
MEVEAVDEGEVASILVAAGTEAVKVNTVIATLKGGVPSATKPQPISKTESIPVAETRIDKPVAVTAPTEDRLKASPLAKRLAKAASIELKQIKGTGPHGRIIAKDVQNGKTETFIPMTNVVRGSASLEQMGIAAGSYDLVPLDNMRKVIARRLTESFRDVPHFPLSVDIELDQLLVARSKINSALESQGVKVSVNDMIIKAVGLSLKSVPEANASFTADGIALHHHADVAVAVAIEGGLITPIVRKAEEKSLAAIAKEMKDLANRARTRKLKPEEFQGGTFSVSNLGMFGIKQFASIINEPQGCILSVGAGEPRPIVRSGTLMVATVMTVTLTCDHRVVDGSVGARFITHLKTLLEDPIKMLA